MSSAFPTATPVQFTPALLESLDNSKESALSRAQRKEQLITAQVNKHLDSIISEKSNALNAKIESQLIKSDDNAFAGSPEITTKLDKIYTALQTSAENKIIKPKALINAEKIVTQCLLTNSDKPLKCWEQVEAFKRIAGNA